jgi:hypothetical protein
LVAIDAPIILEVVDRLVEVVSGGVDGRVVPGSAEGDVGELPAPSGGEDVGSVVGGALCSVDGQCVGVVEVGLIETVASDISDRVGSSRTK